MHEKLKNLIFILSFPAFIHYLCNMRCIRQYVLVACTVFSGCGDVFQYHPYDVRFSGDDDINRRNVALIESVCAGKDTLRVAFVGDTHGWYGDTEDMVDDINGRAGVDFVIHGGDLTDCGTTREYVWQRDRLARLRVPYVALIGNHDFLGTGDEVFAAMYGPVDFSFIAAGIKFVCLNTNATEYDYLAAVPNFDFMERQAKEDTDRFDRTVVCMHARPFCEQFNNNVATVFELYVRALPGLMFCLTAHNHRIEASDLYGDGVMYYGTDCAEHRNYLLFTITPDDYAYEVIHF